MLCYVAFGNMRCVTESGRTTEREFACSSNGDLEVQGRVLEIKRGPASLGKCCPYREARWKRIRQAVNISLVQLTLSKAEAISLVTITDFRTQWYSSGQHRNSEQLQVFQE